MVGEPAGLGGTEAGPAPYDYPLTALESCTAMTLRTYADRKGWPLEAVTVRLGHQRIHAKDRAERETKSGRLDHIELERDLEGPLEPEQRERLREMADQCPVKRTLGPRCRSRPVPLPEARPEAPSRGPAEDLRGGAAPGDGSGRSSGAERVLRRAEPLSAPMELGQRVHSHRAGPPEPLPGSSWAPAIGPGPPPSPWTGWRARRIRRLC